MKSLRDEANPIGECQTPGREGVLVDKGEHVAVRHLLQLAEAEAEQDALFDPGIDDPASVNFLGGANLAASQSGAEVEKRWAGFVGLPMVSRPIVVRWPTSEWIENLA
jgi:hypothetical protein